MNQDLLKYSMQVALYTDMEKSAVDPGMLEKLMGMWKAAPDSVKYGLLGAGVGAGAGALSSLGKDEEDRDTMGSALTGAIGGAAALGGGKLLYDRYKAPSVASKLPGVKPWFGKAPEGPAADARDAGGRLNSIYNKDMGYKLPSTRAENLKGWYSKDPSGNIGDSLKDMNDAHMGDSVLGIPTGLNMGAGAANLLPGFTQNMKFPIVDAPVPNLPAAGALLGGAFGVKNLPNLMDKAHNKLAPLANDIPVPDALSQNFPNKLKSPLQSGANYLRRMDQKLPEALQGSGGGFFPTLKKNWNDAAAARDLASQSPLSTGFPEFVGNKDKAVKDLMGPYNYTTPDPHSNGTKSIPQNELSDLFAGKEPMKGPKQVSMLEAAKKYPSGFQYADHPTLGKNRQYGNSAIAAIGNSAPKAPGFLGKALAAAKGTVGPTAKGGLKGWGAGAAAQAALMGYRRFAPASWGGRDFGYEAAQRHPELFTH